jgi:hypothetical protein
MDIKFADSFSKSLKKLIWHESRVYKFWAFFRYDISRFIKNVWRFRKALANHYWWDHHGTLMFLETGLTHMSDNLEVKGMEVDGPRMKKVAAMRRAVEIIKNYNQSNFIDMAEAELGPIYLHDWEFEEVPDKPGYSRLIDKDTPEEKKHNRKVFDRAREIEDLEWKELFEILQGQNHKEYSRLYKKAKKEGMGEDRDLWNNWFNGTGLKGWWD